MNRRICFGLAAGAVAAFYYLYRKYQRSASQQAFVEPSSFVTHEDSEEPTVVSVVENDIEDAPAIEVEVIPTVEIPPAVFDAEVEECEPIARCSQPSLHDDEVFARQLQFQWETANAAANDDVAPPAPVEFYEAVALPDEEVDEFDCDDDYDWKMEDHRFGDERDVCLNKVTRKAASGLKKFAGVQQKRETRKRSGDKKKEKSARDVAIDKVTLAFFDKLIRSNIVNRVNGMICVGKQSILVHADGCQDTDMTIPKECAIKVFKSSSNQYKRRDQYIEHDYRFRKGYKGKAYSWAEKEMHNLDRMHKAGIPCPAPITLMKHILVMSFLGRDGLPALKLADAAPGLSAEEIDAAYCQVVSSMYKLFNDCKLVHCDLSEYNILYFKDKCWIIDVSQAVEPCHPNANEYLLKDCVNVVNFFRRMGASNVSSSDELFNYIWG